MAGSPTSVSQAPSALRKHPPDNPTALTDNHLFVLRRNRPRRPAGSRVDAGVEPVIPYTPRKIYRALDKSAECGGCIRLFAERMRSNAQPPVPAELPADVLTPLRDLWLHSR